jgi:hypothetical protein
VEIERRVVKTVVIFAGCVAVARIQVEDGQGWRCEGIKTTLENQGALYRIMSDRP